MLLFYYLNNIEILYIKLYISLFIKNIQNNKNDKFDNYIVNLFLFYHYIYNKSY